MSRYPVLRPRQHLPDTERSKLGEQLLKRYEAGQSVRELCAETGYSIGRVRGLLKHAGVQFRSRGGAVRAHKKA
jgi:hypothetical protein